jgi:NAD(P)-dependent dehydrogenase (short-subunit alcohol dehydrogenase family)
VEVSLEGKVALVTGVGPNIGSGVALALARYGAKVACNDVSDDVIKACIARIERNGGEAMAAPGDVTDESAVQGYVDAILEKWGRIDILVNNAAILDVSPFDELTQARFSEVLRVNLDGALLCTMAAVPALARAGGGRILNIASIMGLAGSRDSIPYSTAKGGLVNLTRCLACDLAPRNITVNALAPGFIDTRMAVLADGRHEHATELFRTVYLEYRKIPLGRAGQPDDIAGPAFFLCSDDARYVTGQVLVVDGGVTMTF